MSDLSSLTDQNGFIKIAALDHRDSLMKLLPQDEMADFKSLCTDVFGPFCTSVLVDPEYGENAIYKAKVQNLGILLTREESGYLENPQGRKTKLYEEFDSHKLKEMGATAVKLLVYYNSDSHLAEDQLAIARQVKDEAVQADLPLLLEVVTYPVEGSFYHKGDAILRAIRDLRFYSDVLKLEFPVDIVSGEEEELESALPYLEQMTSSSEQPWVLLSRAMPFGSFKQALELSKQEGCSGFAVGRGVWQEINTFSTKEERENFIRTTAKERMEELSKLF